MLVIYRCVRTSESKVQLKLVYIYVYIYVFNLTLWCLTLNSFLTVGRHSRAWYSHACHVFVTRSDTALQLTANISNFSLATKRFEFIKFSFNSLAIVCDGRATWWPHAYSKLQRDQVLFGDTAYPSKQHVLSTALACI